VAIVESITGSFVAGIAVGAGAVVAGAWIAPIAFGATATVADATLNTGIAAYRGSRAVAERALAGGWELGRSAYEWVGRPLQDAGAAVTRIATTSSSASAASRRRGHRRAIGERHAARPGKPARRRSRPA